MIATTTRRAFPRRLTTAIVVLACTTACGVPTGDGTFSVIPPDEVPAGLSATSTSTTTTTTTTVPDLVVADSTTTTTPLRTVPADFYFLSRGRLQPVPYDMPVGASADQIADVLEDGPPTGAGLDTLVPDGLIVGTEQSRGVLAIDLDPGRFDLIPSTRQTEATAQIVLTMTRNVVGIGQVTFTLGGQPIAVKKANGQLSEIGEPVAFDDYASLIVGISATGTTTTTTTTTPTAPLNDPAGPGPTVGP